MKESCNLTIHLQVLLCKKKNHLKASAEKLKRLLNHLTLTPARNQSTLMKVMKSVQVVLEVGILKLNVARVSLTPTLSSKNYKRKNRQNQNNLTVKD
jgi:cell division protein ZapA (FtsZ GTPase activity inhibitor)